MGCTRIQCQNGLPLALTPHSKHTCFPQNTSVFVVTLLVSIRGESNRTTALDSSDWIKATGRKCLQLNYKGKMNSVNSSVSNWRKSVMPSPEKSALLQTFMVIQIVKNFPAFFVTRSSVTLFTTNRNLCLSSARTLISMLPLFLDKSFCYYCLHKVTAGKEVFKKAMYNNLHDVKINFIWNAMSLSGEVIFVPTINELALLHCYKQII